MTVTTVIHHQGFALLAIAHQEKGRQERDHLGCAHPGGVRLRLDRYQRNLKFIGRRRIGAKV
jgi:hypothetical protein